MSVKVPCKFCGKEISLRKMPNGQFVPFDKWSNTQHRCQEPAPKAAKSNVSSKQQTTPSSTISVGNLVLQVVSETTGLKASQIASSITKKHGIQVDRSEVNRWLYGDLKSRAFKNDSHQWFPGSAPSGTPQKPPPPAPTNTTSYGWQSNPNDSLSEHKTGLAEKIQSPVPPQSSNKLLWAIIALLVVIVFVLMKK